MIVKKFDTKTENKTVNTDLTNTNPIVFKLPAFGPNDYSALGLQILSDNLILPTGYEISRIIHKSYCNQESFNLPEFDYIRKILDEFPLSEFNINYWTDSGVFVFPDIKAEGIYKNVKQKNLENALENGVEINNVMFSLDNKVRFAPKWSYHLGEHTDESIINDGYFIARYGLNGVGLLSDLVKKTGKIPVSYGFDIQEGNQPKLRVSLLDIDSDKIHFVGNNEFGSLNGYAFGIQGYLK